MNAFGEVCTDHVDVHVFFASVEARATLPAVWIDVPAELVFTQGLLRIDVRLEQQTILSIYCPKEIDEERIVSMLEEGKLFIHYFLYDTEHAEDPLVAGGSGCLVVDKIESDRGIDDYS